MIEVTVWGILHQPGKGLYGHMFRTQACSYSIAMDRIMNEVELKDDLLSPDHPPLQFTIKEISVKIIRPEKEKG